MKRFKAIAILLILGGVAAFLLRGTRDGCMLLDQSLASEARSPKKLLEVMGWRYDRDPSRNPYGLGYPEFFDLQHQALVRLLALQDDVFGINVPAQNTSTLRVDHSGAMLLRSNSEGIVIDGSSSMQPDEFNGPHSDPYYIWERFEFDESGRFQRRTSVNH
jgi:hypothetical protein